MLTSFKPHSTSNTTSNSTSDSTSSINNESSEYGLTNSTQLSSGSLEDLFDQLTIRKTTHGKPKLCYEGYYYTIDTSVSKIIEPGMPIKWKCEFGHNTPDRPWLHFLRPAG